MISFFKKLLKIITVWLYPKRYSIDTLLEEYGSRCDRLITEEKVLSFISGIYKIEYLAQTNKVLVSFKLFFHDDDQQWTNRSFEHTYSKRYFTDVAWQEIKTEKHIEHEILSPIN